MKQTHKSPSEQLRLSDEVAGYFLNRAVLMFGSAVEDAVKEKTKNIKNEKTARAKAGQELARWLAEPGTTPPGMFRDPAAR